MTAPTAPGRSELAAERIREDILSGAYRAGDRLPGERDMAAQLGVNRGAVREALKTLEIQGLVATRRGGTVVCALQDASISVVRHLLATDGEPNADMIAQLLDVQSMLIVGAARLAVERGSDDDLLHALELTAALGDATLHPERMPELVDDFLDLITKASGNLVLLLWRNTVRPALAERLAPLRLRIAPDPAIGEIVEALARNIRERDAAAAEQTVRRLLLHRRDQLLAQLHAPASAPDAGTRAT
ncbi:MAG: FadR/GntR family transcriptional regulator [Myxococcota bacterium]